MSKYTQLKNDLNLQNKEKKTRPKQADQTLANFLTLLLL
jgi:hypothetical protein